MKDNFELKISADGTIETIYQEGLEQFAEEIGGDVAQACRVSNVEFEEIDGKKGWTVRAAHDLKLAIRWEVYFGEPPKDWKGGFWVSTYEGAPIAVFETREEALAQEVRFFWVLKGNSNGKRR